MKDKNIKYRIYKMFSIFILAMLLLQCLFLFKLGLFTETTAPGNILLVGLSGFAVSCIFFSSIGIWNIARTKLGEKWVVVFNTVSSSFMLLMFFVLSSILIYYGLYDVAVNGALAIALMMIVIGSLTLHSILQTISVYIIDDKHSKEIVE